MSNIEKFYALAFKNPSLAGAIKAAEAAGPENFMTIAIELGKAHGCVFTTQEATDFFKAKSEASAKGELDDLQLEAVAGGKGDPGQFFKGIGEIAGGAGLVVIGVNSPGGFGAALGADGVNNVIHGSGG